MIGRQAGDLAVVIAFAPDDVEVVDPPLSLKGFLARVRRIDGLGIALADFQCLGLGNPKIPARQPLSLEQPPGQRVGGGEGRPLPHKPRRPIFRLAQCGPVSRVVHADGEVILLIDRHFVRCVAVQRRVDFVEQRLGHKCRRKKRQAGNDRYPRVPNDDEKHGDRPPFGLIVSNVYYLDIDRRADFSQFPCRRAQISIPQKRKRPFHHQLNSRWVKQLGCPS